MHIPTPDTFHRTKSAKLFKKAKKMFPGGVHSPVRAFGSVEGPPIFFEKGKGAYITDVDGQSYLDFCSSWGPQILGHAHPKVMKKIVKTISNSTSFGTPTEHGNRLGKLLLDNNRFVEMVRFVSSGTEAVMSAIRLARGVTGRDKVIKFEGCYHGHLDALMVKAGSGLVTLGTSTSAGIPEAYIKETLVLPLNNEKKLDQILKEKGHEIACVIIEPIPANNGLLLQDRSFLLHLREKCTEYGILLIFDEVISGFRVGFEGAAGLYNIQPDIITYGKIIGGGMPVGAYAASKKIMEHIAPVGPVYQAGTLSANPVAMAAGYATLLELLKPGFYEDLEKKTKRFTNKITKYCIKNDYPLRFQQMGSIFWFRFSEKRITKSSQIDPAGMSYFKVLHLEMLKRGLYFGPSGYEVGFISAAQTKKDLDWAAERVFEALDVVFKK